MKTPKNLLSIDTNAKTVKGQKFGFKTAILYMAPNNVAGRGTVCPMSEVAQCTNACLYSAGRGKFNNVQTARINKANFYFDAREAFMNVLVRNITKHVAKCEKQGVTPLVRLNGTSDIMWENISFTVTPETVAYAKRYYKKDIAGGQVANIMDIFPDTQFYDYTKIAVRVGQDLPKNYDLTFSYSGVGSYQKSVQYAIKKGARIAVVFRSNEFPSEFMGMQVVNGDNSDIRHIDSQGVVVGLYAKGNAKKDQTGFVVDAV